MQKLHEDARLGDTTAQQRVTQLEEWEAKSVDSMLTHVQKQAEDGSLKAAQFMLKTLRPDRFGGHNPKQEITVTQAPQQVAQTGDAKERILAYAIRLLTEHPEYRQRLMDALPPLLPEAVQDGEIDE